MNKRILVVDDDAMNLKMAEFILTKKQYDVCCVRSGKDCLNILEDNAFDLILLDIEMPEMSGIEVMERLNEAGNTIPVLYLTAAEDIEIIMSNDNNGVRGYVKKPFMPPVLAEKVSEVIGK